MLGYSLSEVIDLSMGLKAAVIRELFNCGYLNRKRWSALFKKRRTQEKLPKVVKGRQWSFRYLSGHVLNHGIDGAGIWDLDGLFGYISVIMRVSRLYFSPLFTTLWFITWWEETNTSGDMFWLREASL